MARRKKAALSGVPLGMVENVQSWMVTAQGPASGPAMGVRWGSVVDLDPGGAQHRSEAELLEDEPARPPETRHPHHGRRRRPGQTVPALLVTPSCDERQPDVVASAEALRDRHGVP